MGFEGLKPIVYCIPVYSILFYSIMVYINDYKHKAHYELY